VVAFQAQLLDDDKLSARLVHLTGLAISMTQFRRK
jgi:hypothetical protein